MFKKLIELLQNCLITKDYFTRKNFTSSSLNDMIKSQVNTIKKIQERRGKAQGQQFVAQPKKVAAKVKPYRKIT